MDLKRKIKELEERIKDLEEMAHPSRTFINCEECKRKIKEKE